VFAENIFTREQHRFAALFYQLPFCLRTAKKNTESSYRALKARRKNVQGVCYFINKIHKFI
jgi:hypothetical protein